ncbi:MAG: hypothetical protein ACXADY_25085 [Candidatus Hodarchaeales archaeon]|jgi:hypothetical protein
MDFKVIKSKTPIQWGNKPEDTDTLYMRIPSPQPNFMLGKVFVNHQYYRFVNGMAYLVEAGVEEISISDYDALITNLVASEDNQLYSANMHDGFYKGALHIITQKQKFNTTAADWEVITIADSDPLHGQHTSQTLL